MKACIVCNCELTDENWKIACKKNYVNKCNSCVRDEKRSYQRTWRIGNELTSRERVRTYQTKLAATNPIKSRAQSSYSDARKRAIKHNMPFDLTAAKVEQLFISAPRCPYFGWELTYCTGKQKTLASLDRIDSFKGYTMDNVQVLSYLANLMKSNSTEEELVLFANGVLRLKGVASV